MVPKFEEIEGVTDADLQKALPRIPDVILAAALLGAPPGVAKKIISNLSKRRCEEVSASAQPFAERTREVARRVLVKVVFGIEDDETKALFVAAGESSRRKELTLFLRKLGKRHPDFLQAREQWRASALMEHLRRMVEEG